MSLPFIREVECGICGKKSTQFLLASTSAWGAPDLDLRAPEPQGNSMGMMVHECPHCGYVSEGLRSNTGIDADWINREEYKTCSGICFKSELAKRFYRHYLIKKACGDTREIFDAIVCTAWCCDDDRDVKNAILCRKVAVKEAEVLMEIEPDNEELRVQRIDLLRRARMFRRAVEVGENFRATNELLQKIVDFEVEKSKDKDAVRYRVSDVVR